jgi:NCAIR mutase (PurE)-related protein
VEAEVLKLLQAVQSGGMTAEAALAQLRTLPARQLGEVVHDSHRPLRRGVTEAVFAPGKSDVQLVDAVKASLTGGENCLVTRVAPAQAALLHQSLGGWDVSYHPPARMVTIIQKPVADLGRGEVVVMTAGTSDVPVAEEAAVTCSTLGNRVRRVFDVGVAGIHRLLPHLDAMRDASVIVVAAGMEGALPGVVAGLVACPVIGVPTSVGYGTAFGGIAPLLSMLNSCSGGLLVVNVDNGFGAGVAATLINRKRPFDGVVAVEPDMPEPSPEKV